MLEKNTARIATVSILLKERGERAGEVNDILTRHGDRIIARLGVHLGRTGISDHGALITVIVNGADEEIASLSDELGVLPGIVSRTSVLE